MKHHHKHACAVFTHKNMHVPFHLIAFSHAILVKVSTATGRCQNLSVKKKKKWERLIVFSNKHTYT